MPINIKLIPKIRLRNKKEPTTEFERRSVELLQKTILKYFDGSATNPYLGRLVDVGYLPKEQAVSNRDVKISALKNNLVADRSDELPNDVADLIVNLREFDINSPRYKEKGRLSLINAIQSWLIHLEKKNLINLQVGGLTMRAMAEEIESSINVYLSDPKNNFPKKPKKIQQPEDKWGASVESAGSVVGEALVEEDLDPDEAPRPSVGIKGAVKIDEKAGGDHDEKIRVVLEDTFNRYYKKPGAIKNPQDFLANFIVDLSTHKDLLGSSEDINAYAHFLLAGLCALKFSTHKDEIDKNLNIIRNANINYSTLAASNRGMIFEGLDNARVRLFEMIDRELSRFSADKVKVLGAKDSKQSSAEFEKERAQYARLTAELLRVPSEERAKFKSLQGSRDEIAARLAFFNDYFNPKAARPLTHVGAAEERARKEAKEAAAAREAKAAADAKAKALADEKAAADAKAKALADEKAAADAKAKALEDQKAAADAKAAAEREKRNAEIEAAAKADELKRVQVEQNKKRVDEIDGELQRLATQIAVIGSVTDSESEETQRLNLNALKVRVDKLIIEASTIGENPSFAGVAKEEISNALERIDAKKQAIEANNAAFRDILRSVEEIQSQMIKPENLTITNLDLRKADIQTLEIDLASKEAEQVRLSPVKTELSLKASQAVKGLIDLEARLRESRIKQDEAIAAEKREAERSAEEKRIRDNELKVSIEQRIAEIRKQADLIRLFVPDNKTVDSSIISMRRTLESLQQAQREEVNRSVSLSSDSIKGVLDSATASLNGAKERLDQIERDRKAQRDANIAAFEEIIKAASLLEGELTDAKQMTASILDSVRDRINNLNGELVYAKSEMDRLSITPFPEMLTAFDVVKRITDKEKLFREQHQWYLTELEKQIVLIYARLNASQGEVAALNANDSQVVDRIRRLDDVLNSIRMEIDAANHFASLNLIREPDRLAPLAMQLQAITNQLDKNRRQISSGQRLGLIDADFVRIANSAEGLRNTIESLVLSQKTKAVFSAHQATYIDLSNQLFRATEERERLYTDLGLPLPPPPDDMIRANRVLLAVSSALDAMRQDRMSSIASFNSKINVLTQELARDVKKISRLEVDIKAITDLQQLNQNKIRLKSDIAALKERNADMMRAIEDEKNWIADQPQDLAVNRYQPRYAGKKRDIESLLASLTRIESNFNAEENRMLYLNKYIENPYLRNLVRDAKDHFGASKSEAEIYQAFNRMPPCDPNPIGLNVWMRQNPTATVAEIQQKLNATLNEIRDPLVVAVPNLNLAVSQADLNRAQTNINNIYQHFSSNEDAKGQPIYELDEHGQRQLGPDQKPIVLDIDPAMPDGIHFHNNRVIFNEDASARHRTNLANTFIRNSIIQSGNKLKAPIDAVLLSSIRDFDYKEGTYHKFINLLRGVIDNAQNLTDAQLLPEADFNKAKGYYLSGKREAVFAECASTLNFTQNRILEADIQLLLEKGFNTLLQEGGLKSTAEVDAAKTKRAEYNNKLQEVRNSIDSKIETLRKLQEQHLRLQAAYTEFATYDNVTPQVIRDNIETALDIPKSIHDGNAANKTRVQKIETEIHGANGADRLVKVNQNLPIIAAEIARLENVRNLLPAQFATKVTHFSDHSIVVGSQYSEELMDDYLGRAYTAGFGHAGIVANANLSAETQQLMGRLKYTDPLSGEGSCRMNFISLRDAPGKVNADTQRANQARQAGDPEIKPDVAVIVETIEKDAQNHDVLKSDVKRIPSYLQFGVMVQFEAAAALKDTLPVEDAQRFFNAYHAWRLSEGESVSQTNILRFINLSLSKNPQGERTFLESYFGTQVADKESVKRITDCLDAHSKKFYIKTSPLEEFAADVVAAYAKKTKRDVSVVPFRHSYIPADPYIILANAQLHGFDAVTDEEIKSGKKGGTQKAYMFDNIQDEAYLFALHMEGRRINAKRVAAGLDEIYFSHAPNIIYAIPEISKEQDKDYAEYLSSPGWRMRMTMLRESQRKQVEQLDPRLQAIVKKADKAALKKDKQETDKLFDLVLDTKSTPEEIRDRAFDRVLTELKAEADGALNKKSKTLPSKRVTKEIYGKILEILDKGPASALYAKAFDVSQYLLSIKRTDVRLSREIDAAHDERTAALAAKATPPPLPPRIKHHARTSGTYARLPSTPSSSGGAAAAAASARSHGLDRKYSFSSSVGGSGILGSPAAPAAAGGGSGISGAYAVAAASAGAGVISGLHAVAASAYSVDDCIRIFSQDDNMDSKGESVRTQKDHVVQALLSSPELCRELNEHLTAGPSRVVTSAALVNIRAELRANPTLASKWQEAMSVSAVAVPVTPRPGGHKT